MQFIAKVCGNKPKDIVGVFNIVHTFRQEQLRAFGKVRVDPRIGILVGQKHPSLDFISIKDAAGIIGDSPDEETMILVTHLDTIGETEDLIEKTGAKNIQLHKDNPDPEHVRALKRIFPDHEFWHVIHASQEYDGVAKARELVDAGAARVLFDSIDLKTGARGGTGLEVDEEEAEKFTEEFSQGEYEGRLMLAGGLRPGNRLKRGNIIKKMRRIRPGGIDAHTGLNNFDRSKNLVKVESYFDEALEGLEGMYDLHSSGLLVPS